MRVPKLLLLIVPVVVGAILLNVWKKSPERADDTKLSNTLNVHRSVELTYDEGQEINEEFGRFYWANKAILSFAQVLGRTMKLFFPHDYMYRVRVIAAGLDNVTNELPELVDRTPNLSAAQIEEARSALESGNIGRQRAAYLAIQAQILRGVAARRIAFAASQQSLTKAQMEVVETIQQKIITGQVIGEPELDTLMKKVEGDGQNSLTDSPPLTREPAREKGAE